MSFGKIYETTWWGNPVQGGFGGIYYELANGGGGFVFEITTTESNEAVTIPTNGVGYNYMAKSSDGQEFTNITGDQEFIFADAGVYDITITGDFPAIYINNNSDKLNFTDIKQFGNISWTSFNSSFNGASNLTGSFTDIPDLSGVTSFRNIFINTSLFNGNVSNWDVSTITDMLSCFSGCNSFNRDLSSWNVSNVTIMGGMFRFCSIFNSDISSWDVSSATSMNFMFNEAFDFNQPIGSWNVSNVTNMQYMLSDATSFNQNLENWNIVNVTNFTNFMAGITLSAINYDAILIGWEATLQAAFPSGVGYNRTITTSFGNSTYTGGGTAETARTSLINNFNWTIVDGGIA